MIDYILTNLWILWLTISLLCLILELSSGDFFITCFAIGALVAMISSLFPVSLMWQVVIFAISAVLCIFFVRPAMLKVFHKPSREKVSNADAIINRIGIVSQEIEANGYGRVALDGDDWKAVSSDGREISKGTRVRITGRESIIITVEPAEY